MRQSSALSRRTVTFLFIVTSLAGCQCHRLSRALLPSVYDVHITIDLENLKFTGSETIYVHAYQNLSTIELHSLDLYISDWKIFDGGSVVAIANRTYNAQTQVNIIDLDGFLLADRDYEIKLSFEGEIKDDMKGLYRSSYFESGSSMR